MGCPFGFPLIPFVSPGSLWKKRTPVGTPCVVQSASRGFPSFQPPPTAAAGILHELWEWPPELQRFTPALRLEIASEETGKKQKPVTLTMLNPSLCHMMLGQLLSSSNSHMNGAPADQNQPEVNKSFTPRESALLLTVAYVSQQYSAFV